MNLKRIKSKIIDANTEIDMIKEAKKYYRNENLILEKGVSVKGSPLRNADNRIPHNFHEILTDEKASYLFTYPVQIDIDNNKNANEKVDEVLGEEFCKKLKNQCIEATNCGKSWVHYWIDVEVTPNIFKYALVPTEQIIPIYGGGLEETLEGIIRHYIVYEYDEEEEKDITYKYVEYWTNVGMNKWKFKADSDISEDNSIYIEDAEIKHDLGEVPFIEFGNNLKKQSDLAKYKRLIDLYDRVMSGFANDLDDIQEIIYILKGYGGQDLDEFLGDLKTYKTLKVDSEGNSGVDTLQIDIPVEARKLILEILKKQIYESGQGLQQDVENFGNASGVALKFFYRKLELKAGLLETEFRSSINKLVKAILNYYKISYTKITQTWTRNMISNDLETAQIAQQSVGIMPNKIIWRNHPWGENVEEIEQMRKDEEKSMFGDEYSDLGKQNNKVDGANE